MNNSIDDKLPNIRFTMIKKKAPILLKKNRTYTVRFFIICYATNSVNYPKFVSLLLLLFTITVQTSRGMAMHRGLQQ